MAARTRHLCILSVTLYTMTSRANVAFGIQAFGVSIRVRCQDDHIHAELQHYLFPTLPRTSSPLSSWEIDLYVERSSEGFRIFVNEVLVASPANPHNVALAAVKALDDILIRRIKTLRAVHAGAVLIDGRALLLPGSTHAGKSSLVAELLRRGASHFSDEYALIDNLGRTHSYPRPLLLRNGSPLQSLVLPEELNAAFATEPASIGWILALEYAPGGMWDVRKLSQSEAAMLLLRNSPHEMAQSPEMIDFFVRVAANAVCFEGRRGDAVDAATHIFDLVRRK
jgi:hypothetical protein